MGSRSPQHASTRILTNYPAPRSRRAGLPRYPAAIWPKLLCSSCEIQVHYWYHARINQWAWKCFRCPDAEYIGPRTCLYCHAKPASQQEHLIPTWVGGQAVIPACDACNREKLGQIPVLEWFVDDSLLWVISEEVRYIKGDLASVAELGSEKGAPADVLARIRRDIAWWEEYLRFIERR